MDPLRDGTAVVFISTSLDYGNKSNVKETNDKDQIYKQVLQWRDHPSLSFFLRFGQTNRSARAPYPNILHVFNSKRGLFFLFSPWSWSRRTHSNALLGTLEFSPLFVCLFFVTWSEF